MAGVSTEALVKCRRGPMTVLSLEMLLFGQVPPRTGRPVEDKESSMRLIKGTELKSSL